MDRDTHLELFQSQAHDFARALSRADLGAAVTTCPEWTVRDLARHVGWLHRWASSIVELGIKVETWRPPRPVEYPQEHEGPEAWAAWVVKGAEEAATRFLASEPDARVWAWGADQHVRFWPRRMLVETAVHRLDLAVVLGAPVQCSPPLAVEAIDEFLENLRYAARWRPALHGLSGDNRTLTWRSSDTGDSWQVRLTPTGWWWDRATGQGDVTVEGAAIQLLLELHGRPASVVVEGDDEVLEVWRRATAF